MNSNNELKFNTNNLCKYFHHITDCPEISLSNSCICSTKCRRKSVCCIAVYRIDNTICFQKSYINERVSFFTIHAESKLVMDDELRNVIREHRNGDLTLYLTFQPCHYSGGSSSKITPISCTEKLKQYYEVF